ncbi:MAG: MATE family efflux transporter [[Eubacterium] siraeum]|nr:MATE family efflux transporter [[Eubacterium] siraeum]
MPVRSVSLTEGSPFRLIMLFALPILFGNVFQQLYNIADTAVIGNVLGDSSLAAMGAASPIYSLIIGFANGVTNGFSIVIAKFFGGENAERVRKSAAMTVLLTLVISAVLTAAGLLGLEPLLNFPLRNAFFRP